MTDDSVAHDTPPSPENPPKPGGSAGVVGNAPKRRKPRPIPSWWTQVAEGLARGETQRAVAAALGRRFQVVSEVTRHPRFAGVLEAAERRQRAEAERLLSQLRPRAIAALGAVLEAPGDEVPAREKLAAATTLMTHSAPPSA